MKLDRITLRQIRMPLVHFFETSFSRTYSRDIILVEVSGDGVTGWGEVTAGEHPFYNEEWTASAWSILHDYVAPRVFGIWKRACTASPCTSKSPAARAARSLAVSPSAFRIRWSNCSRKSRSNWQRAISASR